MSRVLRPTSAFSLVPTTKLQRGRATPQQRRARVSKQVYRDTRVDVIERDLHRCVRCSAPGTEVHHRMNRGAGGSNADPHRTHQRSRLVLLCADCHRWVGLNPTAAEADGLLVRHGVVRLEQARLRYRGRWALLTDDNQINYLEGAA